MLLNHSAVFEHWMSWTQRQTNGQQDATEGDHSSVVSQDEISTCPKDMHWSK